MIIIHEYSSKIQVIERKMHDFRSRRRGINSSLGFVIGLFIFDAAFLPFFFFNPFKICIMY